MLVNNGQKFIVDSIDSLPSGLKDVNPSENHSQNGRGIAFFGKSSIMNNFEIHESPFTENGVAYKTVEHYYQCRKDDTTATAIMRSRTPNHGKGTILRNKLEKCFC